MKLFPARLLCLSMPASAQQQAACPYAAWKSGFKGDALVQAACLLRPVKLYACTGSAHARWRAYLLQQAKSDH